MDPSTPRLADAANRPGFPERAVVTAGMPYGNKDLHFGHVGGVFVHADSFARFLRARLGGENVLFVSGTDCYGSPIVEDHRKRSAAGETVGSLAEFAEDFHVRQRETLDAFHVAPDAYAASALSPYVEPHRALGKRILESLHASGALELRKTEQFYDEAADQFLTGRQVLGHCPIPRCKSEKAYAEECDLGHQFEPRDLIAPKSTVSGAAPAMREVANWYLPLEPWRDRMLAWFENDAEAFGWRRPTLLNLLEYFAPPSIYVKKDDMPKVEALGDGLPTHEVEVGTTHSDRIVVDSYETVRKVTAALAAEGIRYRTSKTLAPFRLTGNLDWGLEAPVIDGVEGLTFWVWPESLWAPISFSMSALEASGRDPGTWTDFWCSDSSKVFQFIGEDNVFYYGLAQTALFLALREAAGFDAELQPTSIVANKHLLFLDKKASSSGAVKPPMARDLLEHYSPEELRLHFLSFNLGKSGGRFSPKVLDPSNVDGGDPVMKDGEVLTRQLNRHARSCIYAAQKHYSGRLPEAEVSDEVVLRSETALLEYEAAMHAVELHRAVEIASDYVRFLGKRWNQANPFRDDCDPEKRAPALVDGFHGLRVALVMFHPLAPAGIERVRVALGVPEEVMDWSRAFAPLTDFFGDAATHTFADLPPRADFFEIPASRDDRKS